MRFVGTDAIPGEGYGVEQVLSGELDATFIYPTGGDRVMQIAMDILNKRDFPRETILSTSVVDRDNAPIMKMQTAHISSLDEKIETLNGKSADTWHAMPRSRLFCTAVCWYFCWLWDCWLPFIFPCVQRTG